VDSEAATGIDRDSRLPRATLTVRTAALALLLGLLGLAACGGSRPPDTPSRITLYLPTEPPSLNTVISEDNTSYQILDHISEGLLGFDREGHLIPAVAERWEFDPATGGTFHLRENARWNDGSKVTAQDFVFAWRLAVDPGVGSGYAYIMYPVRHAEAINRGQLPLESLGVSAPDAHTLLVELERPTPYFLSLTAFSVYRPINETFYRRLGARYGDDADALLYNGPYLIRRWIHGADLLLEKNPWYWQRAAIRIEAISYPYFTSDPATVLNLFRDGKIAMADLGEESMDIALAGHYDIRVKEPGVLNYIGLNLRQERPTHSVALRQALQAVIDPEELAGRVIGRPGVDPGVSLYPRWIRRRALDDAAPFAPRKRDARALQDLMAQARTEWPATAGSSLTLLIPDDGSNGRIAEYLQRIFAERLGLRLRIDRQTFKEALARQQAADFDLVLASWAPDFDDPLAYANILITQYADGSRVYQNAEMDRALAIAQMSIDPQQRQAAFVALDRIVNDQVLLIPILESGGGQYSLYVQDPRLEGVRRSKIAGDPNFNSAWLSAQ
jgi:oligopeptide transport system substrate-binding protein